MNDDFLYKNRPNVRPEFKTRLQRELQTITSEERRWDKPFSLLKSIVIPITVVALFVFGLLFSTTEVGARALEWIRKLAGINTVEQPFSPISQPGNFEYFSVQTEPFDSVLTRKPFDFQFPTFVPEGYIPWSTVGISDDWVLFNWKNDNLTEINLVVQKANENPNIKFGEGAGKEITINGKPALLVIGFWDKNHEWDPTLGVSISYIEGQVFYTFIYRQYDPIKHSIAPLTTEDSTIISLLSQIIESMR